MCAKYYELRTCSICLKNCTSSKLAHAWYGVKIRVIFGVRFERRLGLGFAVSGDVCVSRIFVCQWRRASTKNEETRVTDADVAERIASLQLFAHSVNIYLVVFLAENSPLRAIHCTIAYYNIGLSCIILTNRISFAHAVVLLLTCAPGNLSFCQVHKSAKEQVCVYQCIITRCQSKAHET